MNDFRSLFAYIGLIDLIKRDISLLEGLFHSVLLTALMPDVKKQIKDREVKNRYYNSVKEKIEELNEQISWFNLLNRGTFSYLLAPKLKRISLFPIKKKIFEHKSFDKGKEENIDDWILGEGDSQSSLSKKNTYLGLVKSLEPTKNLMSQFLNSLVRHYYLPIKKNEFQFVSSSVKKDFKEFLALYSLGFIEQAAFVIYKSLERNVTLYLLFLKKKGKITYKKKEILSWDFENKINILRKEEFLTPNQTNKILSIKWDRNVFGHPSNRFNLNQAKKDADALIRVGLNLIRFLEKRIKY